MARKRREFREHIATPADGVFIADGVEVRVDSDGYFVTVETCPYEGSAMFTIPAARLVHEALGRAIVFAEERLRERGILPPTVRGEVGR